MTKRSFGDVEFYQAKQDISKRLHKIITGMCGQFTKSPRTVQIIQRFRACIKPTRDIDEGRLPIYSCSPSGDSGTKTSCVFMLISYTIQQYWTFYSGGIEGKSVAESLEKNLTKLEEYIELGLNAFKVKFVAENNVYVGYYLEKK